jgi:predicted aminopeptidase
MRLQQPIDDILENEAVDEKLKTRLETIKSVRRFASDVLALPDNDSYTRYADIQRPFVVWNVFAAPEFSLELKQWCFPFIGCLVYRGYFNEKDARAFADELCAQGYDTYTGGVRAYSTLGWFDDPALNTFLHYDNARLAGLVFHELAHQQLYVQGDTTFNESFASTVEIEGARRWLDSHGSPDEARDYLVAVQRRDVVQRLISEARGKLAAIYESDLTESGRRTAKRRIQDDLRAAYDRLKQIWGDDVQTYDVWFAGELNNAQLAATATYREYVPLFQQLLRHAGNDFQQFYSLAETAAKVPVAERPGWLAQMASMPASGLQE